MPSTKHQQSVKNRPFIDYPECGDERHYSTAPQHLTMFSITVLARGSERHIILAPYADVVSAQSLPMVCCQTLLSDTGEGDSLHGVDLANLSWYTKLDRNWVRVRFERYDESVPPPAWPHFNLETPLRGMKLENPFPALPDLKLTDDTEHVFEYWRRMDRSTNIMCRRHDVEYYNMRNREPARVKIGSLTVPGRIWREPAFVVCAEKQQFDVRIRRCFDCDDTAKVHHRAYLRETKMHVALVSSQATSSDYPINQPEDRILDRDMYDAVISVLRSAGAVVHGETVASCRVSVQRDVCIEPLGRPEVFLTGEYSFATNEARPSCHDTDADAIPF